MKPVPPETTNPQNKPVRTPHGDKAARTRKQTRGVRREYSAGFILFRDLPQGRVYLLLDYGNHWDYPKGHLEAGETAWVAAVRELREETGIRQVDRVAGYEQKMEYQFVSGVKGRIHKQVTYFLGRTKTSQVNLSDEHCGYAWLPFEQAMAQLTYKNAQVLLARAEQHLVQILRKQKPNPTVQSPVQ